MIKYQKTDPIFFSGDVQVSKMMINKWYRAEKKLRIHIREAEQWIFHKEAIQ